MELVVPSLEFESAFASFYDDVAKNDAENAEYYYEGKSDFPRYVQCLLDESKGVNLPEGYVPCSHFWLVNTDKTILGAIRVRHNIENEFLSLEAGHIGYDIAPSSRGEGKGKLMLKLVLPKAKELGIDQALVTADEDNYASRKVIEANGGQFEKIVMGKVFPNPLARYWISCK
ncbi:TPA: GNAT family N-acetyltransferase [Vibrio parahaemolyticus]|uniref:GNAT family N-acetyltransferase n=1 Tax=Vibrio parahaemolyticus TaxID=670 RepID=UPI00329877D9|nr:GNAT family N-acetyltransferase [Vibrio parahaemolyticus]HCE4653431.1 GNAT family N-acetyltransferase [Vibrio parahaemolyticus]HCG8290551.1 GNAT family N-acetyltransferase [Vibrio parahaemolyticus]HCG8295723.1 GNAT family N-acetyltransferase [Vibrio parahaemolyticus]HCG8300946.1 GNAT family N-acetyltransferase [Vibrio parahaemolyticus]